jgi:hypothetical protein
MCGEPRPVVNITVGLDEMLRISSQGTGATFNLRVLLPIRLTIRPNCET